MAKSHQAKSLLEQSPAARAAARAREKALIAAAPLTPAEAAVRLTLDVDYVTLICRRGELEGAYRTSPDKKRGVWRIPLDAIEAYEKRLREAAAAQAQA